MNLNVSIINKMVKITNTGERFPENPFLDYLEIKEKDKMIFAKTDSQAVNKKTGEIMGQQIVATFKKVDAQQFVKIFTDKISHILELTKAGHKLLILVLSHIQATAMNSDMFFLSLADAQKIAAQINIPLSRMTFERGIQDLIKNGLIARHYNQNMYFINPAIIYNGDRTKITFVEQYEIVSEEELSQPSLLE